MLGRYRFMLLPALLLSVGCAATPKGAIPRLSLDDYAQPGILVKANPGRNINIRCSGQGGPTLILTAGAGDQSLVWQSLQSTLSADARVCAWDRAGFGFSDPSPEPQDVNHRTNDMERALSGAGIKPPYILVGHSIASFETLMFAFRHPRDVAGIVLIDPSTPDQDERIKRAAPDFYAVLDPLQKGRLAWLEGCATGADAAGVITNPECLDTPPAEYPQVLKDRLSQVDRQAGGKRNFLSMMTSMLSGQDSAQLKAAWHSLGNIPITVLTAGSPPPLPVTGAAKDQIPAMQTEWSKMHDEMARLSTHGVNRTVEGATHYIQQDRPQIVLDAIKEVQTQARANLGDKAHQR